MKKFFIIFSISVILIGIIPSVFAATDYSEMTDEELIDRWEELLTTGMEMTMQDAMDKFKAGEIYEALADELVQQMTEWQIESQEIVEELKKRGYEFEAGVLTTDDRMSPIITISKPILTNDVISPKMQMKRGTSSSDVICNEGLKLIFKNNGSPACVKPSTVEKLIQRGWATDTTLDTQPDKGTKPDVTPKDYPINIVDANNQFALDFYSQVVSDNKDNIFFSPLSISTAFVIAYEGAKGTTADEIRDVFGFIKDDEERRNAFANTLDQLNEKDAQYKLQIANALWIKENFELVLEYVDTAKTFYDSEVNNVNFLTDGTDIINEWVSEKTEGKIEKLITLDSVNEGTRLIITNAIYFKGTWVKQFDESDTVQEDFIINTDNIVKVPMMKLDKNIFKYTKNEQLQVIQLPYAGDTLSMLILLPNDVGGIKSLEESFTTEKLNQWKGELVEQSVIVEMPKFTMKTSYGLTPHLQNLGMHTPFDLSADFSGIADNLFIQAAIHKAFVDVNEEGTEAAAVTGIGMGTSSSPPPPPIFRADHPFIFLIQENETGNILFMGRVVNPIE